ncbi:hypothetical protein BDW_10215 [Bdellovibrio bacteriovorus W]|nr:hypothetical protein BDW_10215 [Bdellovibrio bacteriovorus W]
MIIFCKGLAKIQHKETNEVYEIEEDDISWECISSEERQMCPEFVYEAILDHSDLGEIRWEIIEYPVGVVNRLHTSSSEDHAILENFSFGLEHDGNEADEWLDHEIESSPFEKFMNSHEDSLKLLHVEADKYAQPILYRMLHSQQITALEAYLGDTLINRINEDQKTLQSLLENDLDLGKLKFNLLEISSSNSFAKVE